MKKFALFLMFSGILAIPTLAQPRIIEKKTEKPAPAA